MRAILAVLILLLGVGGVAPARGQAVSAPAAAPSDVETLDGIIAAFYDIVSGPEGQARDWARDRTLYLPTARFTYQVGKGDERRWQSVDQATYAREAGPSLEKGFFEHEIHREVHQFGDMAQVFSTYAWSSPTKTGPQRGRGINSIELIHKDGRWWISYVQWASESSQHPIPSKFVPRGKKKGK